MAIFSKPAHYARVIQGGLIVVLLLLFSVPTPTRAQSGANTGGDFGDAPDATNHDNVAMNAYIGGSGLLARYPTVYDATQAGPQGPWHRNPRGHSWLGTDVSAEDNADGPGDSDGVLNLRAITSMANSDHKDDSLGAGRIELPDCGPTTFTYTVSAAVGVVKAKDYVNVWIDYNRNGRWGDTITCTQDDGKPIEFSEWVVINQEVFVSTGPIHMMTPPFYSAHQGTEEHLWMRITLSDVAAAESAKDGSGPTDGFRSGETEDYPLKRWSAPATSQATKLTGGGGTYVPDVAYYYGY